MTCALCGGELSPLGRLGRRQWSRCVDCGLDQSVPTSQETDRQRRVDIFNRLFPIY